MISCMVFILAIFEMIRKGNNLVEVLSLSRKMAVGDNFFSQYLTAKRATKFENFQK